MNDDDLKLLASAIFKCANEPVKAKKPITKEVILNHMKSINPNATEDNLWRNPDGTIAGVTA